MLLFESDVHHNQEIAIEPILNPKTSKFAQCIYLDGKLEDIAETDLSSYHANESVYELPIGKHDCKVIVKGIEHDCTMFVLHPYDKMETFALISLNSDYENMARLYELLYKAVCKSQKVHFYN